MARPFGDAELMGLDDKPVNIDITYPGEHEELFLKTIMVVGAPPQRPKLKDFEPDVAHAAYFRRVELFWQQQGVKGDAWAMMAFYNVRFVRWLNDNHKP